MNRQFDTAQIVCPCCGHVFGEQAYFQSFEVKVAGWLQGKIAPPATKGYDVFDSPHFSEKTFQVKYAQAFMYKGSKKKYPPVSWRWTVKNLDPVHPDFFVFFGISLDGRENCFLLSRNDFIAYANHASDDRYYLNVSAKDKSDRENYNYRPKIWLYQVLDPAINLVQAVANYQDKHTHKRGMYFETLLPHLNDIRALIDQGASQADIAKRYHTSQGGIGRFLKWAADK